MIVLSGREIVGAPKITDRQAQEFKKLVASVDACGNQEVTLDLTDLDATTLWKREKDYYNLISRPNLTVIVDPETAATILSYSQITRIPIKYIVKELAVVPEEENPDIAKKGELYASKATSLAVFKYTYYSGKSVSFKNCLVLKIQDVGLDVVSSIGITCACVQRAIEILAKQAFENGQKLILDVTDIVFEGGSDIVLVDKLVELKRVYKHLVARIVGDENGMDEYVLVNGRVKLSATSKIRFFRMLKPDTVLCLSFYPTASRSDIAGRKGCGSVTGSVIVIYRGIVDEDVLYDEIPTQNFYLPCDLEPLCIEAVSDKYIPRRRNVVELGIYGVCSGSHGHFGPVSRKDLRVVTDGNGALMEIPLNQFIARGLDYLGYSYNKELLSEGRILQVNK